jgi:hypothetical protein
MAQNLLRPKLLAAVFEMFTDLFREPVKDERIFDRLGSPHAKRHRRRRAYLVPMVGPPDPRATKSHGKASTDDNLERSH